MSLLENNREKAALLFSAFILVIITLVSGGMAIYVVSDPGISNAVTLTRAAYKIRDNYPEEYDFSRLIDNARRGMLSQFDRYTGYLEKSQFENLDEEFTGEYSGIGVSVVKDDDGLMIMSIRENGPSGNIGLLTGDVIIVVDSQSIESASVIQSTKLLRGKAGTEVAITVHRKFSFDTLHFTITRGKIPLLHIPFAGYRADSILYIRLLDFEMGASSDLNAALDSLLSEADRKNAKGLILDLRGNPGGLFSEAYRVSDIFLEKGISIVGTSGRSRWDSERFYSESPDKTRGLPMAILVDNGSASSAEITAGALKEAGRAILIGDTTFGKGLVQGFIRFQDGDGLRLTISRYFVGDSLYLNRIDSDLNESGDGLIPDFYFEQETKSNLLMSLDNSLLLNRFVYENKIEIIAAIENNNLNNRWIDSLILFARENFFSYSSPIKTDIELLSLSALLDNAADNITVAIAQIYGKVKEMEEDEFMNQSDKILHRIRELAVEAEYGSFTLYQKLRINEMPIINYSAQLLKGEH